MAAAAEKKRVAKFRTLEPWQIEIISGKAPKKPVSKKR